MPDQAVPGLHVQMLDRQPLVAAIGDHGVLVFVPQIAIGVRDLVEAPKRRTAMPLRSSSVILWPPSITSRQPFSSPAGSRYTVEPK